MLTTRPARPLEPCFNTKLLDDSDNDHVRPRALTAPIPNFCLSTIRVAPDNPPHQGPVATLMLKVESTFLAFG